MPRLSGSVSVAVAALAAAAIGCGSDETVKYQEVPVRWDVASVAGRALTINYEGGGCLQGVGRAIVEESADDVEIRVRDVKLTGKDVFCTGEMALQELRIRLKKPLGDRTLVGETPGLAG